MSEWMNRLIKKHTCKFCNEKMNKKEIYTVHMDTADGAHTIELCQKCAEGVDSFLASVESLRDMS